MSPQLEPQASALWVKRPRAKARAEMGRCIVGFFVCVCERGVSGIEMEMEVFGLIDVVVLGRASREVLNGYYIWLLLFWMREQSSSPLVTLLDGRGYLLKYEPA